MLFGQVNFVIGGGAAMTTGSVKKAAPGLDERLVISHNGAAWANSLRGLAWLGCS